MLSSEGPWHAPLPFDRLNNDVLRKIYVEYVKLLNEKRLDEISDEIADGISGLIATTMSTVSTRGFCHRGVRSSETITGVVRPYGMGRVITVDFGDAKCVFRLKRVADSYAITDWECNKAPDDGFVHRVARKTELKFNSAQVSVDNRKPSRRWVRIETRDKFIEELVLYTNLAEARVGQIVDG